MSATLRQTCKRRQLLSVVRSSDRMVASIWTGSIGSGNSIRSGEAVEMVAPQHAGTVGDGSRLQRFSTSARVASSLCASGTMSIAFSTPPPQRPANGLRSSSTFVSDSQDMPSSSGASDDAVNEILQTLDIPLDDASHTEHAASADKSIMKMDDVMRLANQKCTPLKLVDMYKYAVDFNDSEQRLRNAQFIYKELPIRIAQRTVDLLTLPHGLSNALPIQQVTYVYLRYMKRLQDTKNPTNMEEEQQFTDILQGIVLDRTSIPTAIARGVATWRETEGIQDTDADSDRLLEMEEALYRFFTARVGLRFLAEHHILSSPSRLHYKELRRQQTCLQELEDDFFLGCILTDCCPKRELQKVVKDITRRTKDYYGMCPELDIVEIQKGLGPFTYVPHHLHYMAGELIKNSCRATIQRHLQSRGAGIKKPLHPIKIVIVRGAEDVTIKVADRGGGIPRSKIDHIWKFAHSTTSEEEESSDFGVDQVTGSKIRGFGLPLARIYARYFGGELTLKSMEGYGLDAYLYLPRLGENCENLPSPVRQSPAMDISLPRMGLQTTASTTRN